MLHYLKPDAASLAFGHETVPTVTRSVEQDHRRKVKFFLCSSKELEPHGKEWCSGNPVGL